LIRLIRELSCDGVGVSKRKCHWAAIDWLTSMTFLCSSWNNPHLLVGWNNPHLLVGWNNPHLGGWRGATDGLARHAP
jgi:hypothetical protein